MSQHTLWDCWANAWISIPGRDRDFFSRSRVQTGPRTTGPSSLMNIGYKSSVHLKERLPHTFKLSSETVDDPRHLGCDAVVGVSCSRCFYGSQCRHLQGPAASF